MSEEVSELLASAVRRAWDLVWFNNIHPPTPTA